MAYLEDSDRFQIRMGSLEEEISKDNPVRFIVAFLVISSKSDNDNHYYTGATKKTRIWKLGSKLPKSKTYV